MDWKGIRFQPHIWHCRINSQFLLLCCVKGFYFTAYEITLSTFPHSSFDQSWTSTKTENLFIVFCAFRGTLRLKWCNHVIHMMVLVMPVCVEADPVEVEKAKTAKHLMFTTRVILVDLKYKMLWCMLEISAVNMPSKEKQVFFCSFICFCFHSPSFFSSPVVHSLATCLL